MHINLILIIIYMFTFHKFHVLTAILKGVVDKYVRYEMNDVQKTDCQKTANDVQILRYDT